MSTSERDLLRIYLADHLAGASAGAARFRRMAEAYHDTPVGPDLARIAEQVSSDRDWLEQTIDQLGLRPSRIKQAATTVAERVARLKPNGHLIHQSPLSALLELEVMRAAVVGKRGVWETLSARADVLGLDSARLDELLDSADEQARTLTRLGEIARERTFPRAGIGA